MADDNQGAAAPGAGEAPAAAGKQLAIKKIYLKDCSFEAPNAPGIFGGEWTPEINLNLTTSNASLGDDGVEVVLSITAEAKINDQSAFLAEVQQAGVFLMIGFGEEERRRILGAYCPSLLFPYAREAISDLVGKGGFPHLVLQPMNFDGLYDQQQEEMRKASAEAGSAGEKH